MESRHCTINLDALRYNFLTIKRHVGQAKVMPIVKANAYGHGLVPCAQFLQSCGADALGVALVEEGVQLRKAGIAIPILVLGSFIEDQISDLLDYNLEMIAPSVGKVIALNEIARRYGKKARIHLKIDTGAGRTGIRFSNAEQLFLQALKSTHCEIVGVASHFATADEEDPSFMNEQRERFLEATSFFEKHSLPMPIRHIAGSAGILRSSQSHLDMVRPGIALYGVYPASWMKPLLPLRPVMSLSARAVYFKVVQKGCGVSYGLTWKAPEDRRVITIPVGYGDGYSRSLSNKGMVLVRGQRCSIIGRICMDQMMVDVGHGEAYVGDEVVLVGEQDGQCITVNDLVDLNEGSAYEFLATLNMRIPRVYVQE